MSKSSGGNHSGPNQFEGSDFFNAHDQTAITITPRDRLMRAWEDTMEHARDYRKFSVMYENTPEGDVFKDAAEKQGLCAAKLHDMLKSQEQNVKS